MYTRIAVSIFFLSLSVAFSQLSSPSAPVDARSIALGESFVAVNHPLSTLQYNPASYNPASGLSLAYSTRDSKLSEDYPDFRYYNIAASYNSSIGEFAFLYKRFDWGELYITTPAYPEGTAQAHAYDHVFLAKYSRTIGKIFSYGLAIKTFSLVMSQIDGGPPSDYLLKTTSTPVLFDIGVMFSRPLFSNADVPTDNYAIGLSLQNFGTDFRATTSGNSSDFYVRLPRYLRAGFSYTNHGIQKSDDTPSLIGFMVSAEYMHLLNTSQDVHTIGFGAECVLYELLALRIGGSIPSYSTVYSNEDEIGLRFGAGINLPLKYLSIDTPIKVTFDYAAMSLKTNTNYGYFYDNRYSSLPVFSIGIEYPNILTE